MNLVGDTDTLDLDPRSFTTRLDTVELEILNDEKSFFLKQYTSRPGDYRDRLFNEQKFLELLLEILFISFFHFIYFHFI